MLHHRWVNLLQVRWIMKLKDARGRRGRTIASWCPWCPGSGSCDEVVVFWIVTCDEDWRGLDGAAEADDTIKLVLPKNNPTKIVTTTAVVNIPKRVFIAVNEFITSIKSDPVKVVYLCHNVLLGRTKNLRQHRLFTVLILKILEVGYESQAFHYCTFDHIHIWPAGIVLSLLPPHWSIGQLTTTFVGVIVIWPFDWAAAIAVT